MTFGDDGLWSKQFRGHIPERGLGRVRLVSLPGEDDGREWCSIEMLVICCERFREKLWCQMGALQRLNLNP